MIRAVHICTRYTNSIELYGSWASSKRFQCFHQNIEKYHSQILNLLKSEIKVIITDQSETMIPVLGASRLKQCFTAVLDVELETTV